MTIDSTEALQIAVTMDINMVYVILFNAVTREQLDIVSEYISNSRVDINKAFHDKTILDTAIQKGSVEIVELLLKHPNINVNKQKHHTESPLCKSLLYAHAITFNYIKDKISIFKNFKSNCRKIMEMLIRHPSLDMNNHEDNFFSLACGRGEVDMLRLILTDPILKVRVKTNVRDAHGDSPSHWACIGGHVNVIKLLHEFNAFRAFVRNKDGIQPFHVACAEGQLNAVRFMLKEFSILYHMSIQDDTSQDILFKGLEIASKSKDGTDVVRAFADYLLIKIRPIDITTIKQTETVLLIVDTLRKVTNPSCWNAVCSLMREQYFTLDTSVFESLYSLFKTTYYSLWGLTLLVQHKKNPFRLDKNNIARIMLHRHYVMFAVISNIYENAVSFADKHYSKQYMLYHAVSRGITDLVLLIITHWPFYSITERIEGISLGNIALKHHNIRSLLGKNQISRQVANSQDIKEFSNWFSTKRFLSSSISLIQQQHLPIRCSGIENFIKDLYLDEIEQIYAIDKIIKLCSILNDDPSREEKQLVLKTIQQLLCDISKEVSQINQLYTFKAMQVGSSMEGTRPFRPDEFIFLLICTEIIRYLEISQHIESHTSVSIKLLDPLCPIILQKQWIMQGGYFNFVEYSWYLRRQIYIVLKHLFQTGSYGPYLYIESLFHGLAEIPCIHLKWRGPVYKDMSITIDLVPALRIRNYNPKIAFVNEPCEYYTFPKGIFFHSKGYSLWPVAFSEVELKLVCSLPEQARSGLKLAKGVRIRELFPKKVVQLLHNVSSLDDCLKTYMLKTNVIVLSKVVPKATKFDDVQWAYMTYALVVQRLLLLGSIPHIFDVSPQHNIFTVFACRHDTDIPCEEERKCCIQRKNLVIIALNIREVLRICLENEGKDIAQLDTFVFEALRKQPFEWFISS